MNFVVNDVAATPNAGGVYSILSDLYTDVLNKDHKNQWFFILSGKYFPESDNVKILVRKDLKESNLKKLLFEKYLGRNYINKLKPDVYISLQNIATYGVKAPKQVVYLHQPIPFQTKRNFSFFKKNERKLAVYQKLIGNFIKRSLSKVQPQVIVQTNWMKTALIKQTKVLSQNIIIAHPKVNLGKNKIIYKGNGHFFIYPASNFLYKNHQVINDACNLLNKNGVKDFKVTFTLNKNQLKYRSNNIEYIGHINRAEVMKKYQDNVLIFPSYIESFGLPLIEAAIHADIVLASDTVFARELLSNYDNVYYFPFNDAQKLAFLMQDVIRGKIVSDKVKIKVKDNGESLLKTIYRICDE